MARKLHKDLEFHVQTTTRQRAQVFQKWEEACTDAVAASIVSGERATIDVVAWSPAAARAWGGEEAYELAKEDPELSVLERIVVLAESQGHVR